ncbi:MAG: hypothetical protein IJD80_07620, partial [Oscillospiraceae bacterium]|nr:hypothetical protein [Oscillospiraceae bacterium]
MAQSDIDKILEDIKRRKERSQSAAASAPVRTAEKTAEPQQEDAPQPEKEENLISQEDRNTLSAFINNSLPRAEENTEEENLQFYDTDSISKKSEDYIDDSFMEFFTKSVIVTKAPEQTGNVQVKRKKGGWIKRKYITDSLSLNVEKLAEEEEKQVKKERRRAEAEGLPIVKTASDVWARQLEKEQPAEKAQEKPAAEEIQAEETVKVYKPKQTHQSLNSILGDDKDPESLAKRILRQRKQNQPAEEAVTEKAEEVITTEIKVEKKEPPKPVATVPDENDGIISSIYTSIIEKQAQEELAADEMTGFIPEFEDEEEEEKTVIQPVITENEDEEEEVFEEYISKSEFFDKPDDESQDIQSELMSFRQTLNIRIFLGFTCGIVLAY